MTDDTSTSSGGWNTANVATLLAALLAVLGSAYTGVSQATTPRNIAELNHKSICFVPNRHSFACPSQKSC